MKKVRKKKVGKIEIKKKINNKEYSWQFLIKKEKKKYEWKRIIIINYN